jgi:hypothetical protein
MQKKIIIFISILFIASSSWLFYINQQETNPNKNKNWWSISFQNPRSNDLTFIIENHSQETAFHWQLLKNNKILTQDDLKINNNSSKKIPLNLTDFQYSSLTGKLILQVKTKSSQKEIYKNL